MINELAKVIEAQGKDAKLGAYTYAIMVGNIKAFEEAVQMGDTATLEQVLERNGFIARWEARGEAKGIAIGEAKGKENVLRIAQNLIDLGLPFETIVSVTQLESEKVRALYR